MCVCNRTADRSTQKKAESSEQQAWVLKRARSELKTQVIDFD